MLKRLIAASPEGTANAVIVSLTTVGRIGQQLRSQGTEICELGMKSVFSTPVALWRLVGLAERLREALLVGRFVLLGERGDAAVCLSMMDVFCKPSHTEGFPNGLGEAMAIGLPYIATLVGAKQVLAGNTVTLVPPVDEDALARAILDVLNLPVGQRRQMGQAAKARVMDEFSIASAAERYRAVYQELVSGVRS